MNISRTILSDPVSRWFFSNVKKEGFLVGGYIRDLMRGYISRDKDYVLKGDVREIASQAARKFDGTFVELKKGQIYRVVLKNKEFIDFSYLSSDIINDLRQRDFTINAIAWSPETGIIAPFDNIKDIKDKIIRVINAENLKSDPLRVLRAYRLSAQLGFVIEVSTERYLQKYSGELIKVAPERITEELFKILNTENVSEYLKLCFKHKVLDKLFTINHSKLKENLALIKQFDDKIQRLLKIRHYRGNYRRRILRLLNMEISQGLKRSGLIRLAVLLLNGNFTKQPRDPISMGVANKLKYLRVSRKIINSLEDIHRVYSMADGRITDKRLYEMYKIASRSVHDVAFFLLLLRSSGGKRFINRAEDFIRLNKRGIISGDEIQEMLDIGPCELIGVIQESLRERQFRGLIRNKQEARAWIISNFT
jgi:tRNA nucleotidyltransferase/poly(A) polymerase